MSKWPEPESSEPDIFDVELDTEARDGTTEGLNMAQYVIASISHMSGSLASVTAWLAPFVLVFGGGSWLFIKGMNMWDGISAKLDKLK